jgi:hypothetical protein
MSPTIIVPDRRRRIHLEVISLRRGASWVLGIWRGEGLGKGRERGGQFTSNLRPRWTDPVTARRVPSKWKGIGKGSKGAMERGARGKGNEQRKMRKARGMRHVYCNLCLCT